MDSESPDAWQRRGTTENEDGDGNPRRKKKKANENSKQMELVEPPWGELEDGVIEMVLMRLPVADFFRFRSVCKGWSSLIQSPNFLAACCEITRQPWFYMLESKTPAGVVYDTEANRWRHINLPAPAKGSGKRKIPVAASGGLMCFRSSTGELTVSNPLTGSSHLLPTLKTDRAVLAIAMLVSGSSYKIIVAFGRAPSFNIKVFSSTENCWKEMPLTMMFEFGTKGTSQEGDGAGNHNMFHGRGLLERRRDRLRRGIIHRNQSRELSGLMTVCSSGHEIIHFLNVHGRVVACNIHLGTICIYPQLLPPEIEYSVDLVECGGRVLLVVLLEMMESASLRVWEFDSDEEEWMQIMAMPPAMSKIYYGKKADINCVGYGDLIMVCISSLCFHRVVMCNIAEGTWVELPRCYKPRTRTMKRFVSAYAFEPRIESCV
ncbi:F-box only protein 13-like [Magnolia sinica]|uniref:F-box only protein 13-like n=1 Tax=Magnolia sinica TaxID=86752 RepID=UPI00265A4773|nr:F-box only protein 13-like [Magnolia sinica]XP_058103768.1 F-box only protein 13-like [Magnolia sinica]XP_058103769.1 F-box only protein 13-like [Magnolia sinica]